ncbi:MAG: hypothetical protein JJU30_12960 [Alkalimonas sp.]|nr:hypothetical protein [Alkalimonas sp.]
MKSSDLLVRSGTSSELVQLILNLRRSMQSKSKTFSCPVHSESAPGTLVAAMARNFFFHFQYDNTTYGYAIIQLPASSLVSTKKQVVLTDFYIADLNMKPFALGAVMLSYIASHCLSESFARLKVDFYSCESEALLMVLIKSLTPSVSLTNEAAYIYEEQMTVLANCVLKTPGKEE